MPSSRQTASTSSSGSRRPRANIRSARRRSDAPHAPGGWWRRWLPKAERPHLAFAHQFGHGADRVLDRHVGIDAVLVVEVDDIDIEPLQRGFGHRLDVLGAAVDAGHARACLSLPRKILKPNLVAIVTLVAHRLQRLAEQDFVRQRGHRLRPCRRRSRRSRRRGASVAIDSASSLAAIGEAHAHAAEADGGDVEFGSEFAGFHGASPCCDGQEIAPCLTFDNQSVILHGLVL